MDLVYLVYSFEYIGKYVYHVTAKNNAKKILKSGLLPRNSNEHGFKYPNRTYVFIDAEKAFNLGKHYAAASKKQNKKFISSVDVNSLMKSYFVLTKKTNGVVVDSREFIVLQIDLDKVGNVKFYRDNTFEISGEFVAAYTEQPIGPKAISVVDEFILQKS